MISYLLLRTNRFFGSLLARKTAGSLRPMVLAALLTTGFLMLPGLVSYWTTAPLNTRVFIFHGAVFMALAVILKRRLPQNDATFLIGLKSHRALLLLLGWATLLLVLAFPEAGRRPVLALAEWLRLVSGAAAFFVAFLWCRSAGKRRLTCNIVLVVAGLIGLTGLVSFKLIGVATAGLGNRQLLGGVLALALPFIVVLLATRTFGQRAPINWLVAVLLAFVLLLCGNRTSWLACLGGLAVAAGLSLWSARTDWRRVRSCLISLAAGLVVVLLCIEWIGAGPTVYHRMRTLAAGVSVRTFQARLQMWDGGLRLFREHPVVGVGIGAYPLKVGNYKPTLPSPAQVENHGATMSSLAHNEYLQLGAELGLIGLGLYLCTIGGVLFAVVRASRHTKPGLLRSILLGSSAVIVSQAIDALGNPAWRFSEVNLLFWFLLGFGAAAATVVPGRLSDRVDQLRKRGWIIELTPAIACGLCILASWFGFARNGLATIPIYFNDLGLWGGPLDNNYSYAIDRQGGGFIQPGDRGDVSLPRHFNSAQLAASLIADGWELAPWQPGQAPPAAVTGKNLIGAAFDPSTEEIEVMIRQPNGTYLPSYHPRADFNFYRYDPNERVWFHKPGAEKARVCVDPGLGAFPDPGLFRPDTSNRGRYSEFVGYFHVTPDPAPDTNKGQSPRSAFEGGPGLISLLLSCGRVNPRVELADVSPLFAYLPSGQLTASSGWADPAYLSGNYGYALHMPSRVPYYIRVFRGVVVIYWDEETRDSNFFFDDRGLEAALARYIFERPNLTITPYFSMFELRWPRYPTNFVLEARAEFTRPFEWLPVVNHQDASDFFENVFRVDNNSASEFFRLRFVE